MNEVLFASIWVCSKIWPQTVWVFMDKMCFIGFTSSMRFGLQNIWSYCEVLTYGRFQNVLEILVAKGLMKFVTQDIMFGCLYLTKIVD